MRVGNRKRKKGSMSGSICLGVGIVNKLAHCAEKGKFSY